MKQLQMTSELSDLIKKAVGQDVDTAKLAVFETIALNTKPLPGKNGTIFENAVVSPITLSQMVDHINSGNHIPLIADHELFGAPMGRMFHAGLHLDEDGSVEMRSLFYLDESEKDTITKLDAGSLDEVSVAFLSSAFLCSECGWDYFQFGGPENIGNRTCANGHMIGDDGVHADMVGLNQFIELSLVARGAADKPKIVGKSEAKLAPASALRLAAKGFDTNALVVHASRGKEEDMTDISALTTQLSTLAGEKGALTAELGAEKAKVTTLTTERDTAQTALTAANEKVTGLETELAAAKAAKPEGYDATVAENAEAVTFLHEQLDNLMVAKGEAKLEGDKRLTKVADLKAKISELTGNLTSILPVGGVSTRAGEQTKGEFAFDPSAYTLRR